MARLRWLDEQDELEFTGVRGAWNWLMGRGRMSAHELFEKMRSDVDYMITVAREERPLTFADEVLDVVGLKGLKTGL